MPTTYTHDLFGKEVYRKLPSEMKQVIRKHGNLYRIGLHGPDILFYFMVSKNPVSRFGVEMHREKAKAFFEQGMKQVREEGDEALLAYLLGFGCHYLLDSACQPYVDETAEKKIVSHTILEKEFDRALMLVTGKDPYHFYPSDCIVPKWEYAKVIHKALPLVRTINIYISMKMMKTLTNAMVFDDGGRRKRLVGHVLKLGGASGAALLEHFMEKNPVEEAQEPLSEFRRLYNEALQETPDYLQELYSLTEGDFRLSARWNRTYNG